jgi:hypothetical protein
MQRAKDTKLQQLNNIRQHDMQCKKLKHQLDLELKRGKVGSMMQPATLHLCSMPLRANSQDVLLTMTSAFAACPYMQASMHSFKDESTSLIYKQSLMHSFHG